MLERDRVNQVEAVIGIATKIEANEMVGHSALTRDALPPLISALGAIGDSGDAAALKRVAGGIDRNLLLHRREIPTYRDTPTATAKLPLTCLSVPISQVTNNSASRSFPS